MNSKKSGTKKRITPDEINSLFKEKKPSPTVINEENEDEEDDDNLDINNEIVIDDDERDKKSSTSTSNPLDDVIKKAKSFTFGESVASSDNDENEIPEWVKEADKQAKLDKKKSLKKKKEKKFTDKWKFWVACIAGTGFVTAFINMYIQTNGFGTNNQELII